MTPEEESALKARLATLQAEKQRRVISQQEGKKPKSARSLSDYAYDLLLTSAQGPAMNYADEAMTRLQAGAFAPFVDESYGELVDMLGQENRDRVSGFEEDHPIQSLVGQTAASVAALPAAAAAAGPKAMAYAANALKDASFLKKMAAGSAAGGAAFFGAGTGAGEGDISNRLETGAQYVPSGLIMGAALPVAGKVIGKGAEILSNSMGLNKPVSAGGGVMSSVQRGAGKAVNNLNQLAGGDDLAADAVAERRLVKNLTEDYQASPDYVADPGQDDMARMIGELEKYLAAGGNKPKTVAEVLPGDTTKQLGETIASLPGEQQGKAAKFFEKRQKGTETFQRGVEGSSGQRILEDLKGLLGKGQNFDETAEKLIQSRRATAGPLYEKLSDLKIKPDEELLDYLGRIPKEAYAYGNKLAKLEGRQSDLETLPEMMEKLKNVPGAFPELNLREMDFLKQGLDDVVNAYYTKEGARGLGGAAKELRNNFRDHLTKAFPEYGQAREAYAGKTALMDALQQGREILGKDFDQKAFDKMSASEKDLTRLGAFQAFKDFFEEGTLRGANKGDRALNKEVLVERFSKMFDTEDDFSKFMDSLKSESEMTKYGQRVTGNSRTAVRTAMQKELDSDIAGGLTEQVIGGGSLSSKASSAALNYISGLSKNLNKYVSQELGDMMFKELDADTVKRLRNRIDTDKTLSAKQKARAVGYLSGAGAATSNAGEAQRGKTP